MKTAIIVDSNSGMTPADAKEHGIILLSMPFIVNGKVYHEHVDMDHETFFKKQVGGSEIMTSQPAFQEVTDLWNKVLREYDEIVHIPMSSGLSGSCASADMYDDEYDGKVQVVNNQRISLTQRQSAINAKFMADHGMRAKAIKEKLEETRFDSHIYIMVDTMTYLKKGGRVTPAAAAIASVLNLKPVLQINGEKLDAFAKCRGIKKAKSIMLEQAKKDVASFGVSADGKPNCWLGIAHTDNQAEAEAFKKELEAAFPGYDIRIDALPISIAVHIGPGSLAVTIEKVLPEGVQY
ncbi:MAG: DegV family protein [Lachnospiraceae bacterium]|nr:DegV family protein [Candidatus Equihabitans merdae]